MHSIDIGQTILERYVIDEPLGGGGMGDVFMAHHATLAMPVAIKVIRTASAEHLQRFEREAIAMAKVRHVNVVGIMDFGVHDDRPCIVMEYIEGESLATRRERQYYLPWPYAFEMGAQVLDGLHAVHAAGMIHRDVKPENVMLTAGRPEVAKVVDFGIAKLADDPKSRRITSTGIAVGTPAYMPPEQLAATEVGPGTDIYALATMLWEAIAGRLPFGDGVSDLSAKLTTTPPAPVPPPPHPPLTSTAAELLNSMLQPDIAQRPNDAAACADALRDAVRRSRAGQGGATSSPAGPKHRTRDWHQVGHSDTGATDNHAAHQPAPSSGRPAAPAADPPPPAAPAPRPTARPGRLASMRRRPSLTYSHQREGTSDTGTPAQAAPAPAASSSSSLWSTPSWDALDQPTVNTPAVARPPSTETRPPTSIAEVAMRLPTPSRQPAAVAPPRGAAEPAQSFEPIAPPPPAVADTRPLLLVARLPARALSDAQQRRWLATQLPAGARSYTLGGNFWLVAEPCSATAADEVRQRLDVLQQALTERYGEIAQLAGARAPAGFSLTPAFLTGAAPMPEPIAQLMAQLSTASS